MLKVSLSTCKNQAADSSSINSETLNLRYLRYLCWSTAQHSPGIEFEFDRDFEQVRCVIHLVPFSSSADLTRTSNPKPRTRTCLPHVPGVFQFSRGRLSCCTVLGVKRKAADVFSLMSKWNESTRDPQKGTLGTWPIVRLRKARPKCWA